MVHRSAIDYLESQAGNLGPNSLVLEHQGAHRELFLNSMRCLMTTRRRRKLGQNQESGFLDYASCFWSIHLECAAMIDGEMETALKKFLNERWVFLWIHHLATNKHLDVLPKAGDNILILVSKVEDHELVVNQVRVDFLTMWAVEFKDIFRKFESELAQHPALIYKIAPATNGLAFINWRVEQESSSSLCHNMSTGCDAENRALGQQ
jgi:hypothetical protein